MKKLALTAALAALLSYSSFGETLSMSDKDKELYSSDENPGDLYVSKGEAIFKKTFGSNEELAKFFGVEKSKLASELATFPKYMQKAGKVVSLDQALQLAMHEKGLKPFKLTSEDMTFMAAYVFSLANEQKMNVNTTSEHAKEYYDYGKKIYYTQRGERGLSCYSCHSQGVLGMRLRMQILPSLGAPEFKSGATWPAYRMTKSELTPLQKRFQGCMENSSQKKLPIGSKEMTALELYVRSMANNQAVAIPGLKR